MVYNDRASTVGSDEQAIKEVGFQPEAGPAKLPTHARRAGLHL